MQLRDRAEGASAALHGSAGNQGGRKERLELVKNLQQWFCPTCKAKPGQKCFEWTSAKQRMEWDEAVHWARSREPVRRVVARLEGKP